MATKKHPYKILDASKLPGERWKTIPGYEFYYQVSDQGRIRSVDRYVPHPRLYQQFVRGRILKQKVVMDGNKKTGVPSISLQVSLAREGSSKFFNVRRLVFMAFKMPDLDYKSDEFYIININGNGYDCRLKNLKLATRTEKALLAFKRERVSESYLKYADRSKWKKPYGGYSRSRPVIQLSKKGKKIKRYKSISEASRKTGFGQKEIIGVAKGKIKQLKGFIWRYDKMRGKED